MLTGGLIIRKMSNSIILNKLHTKFGGVKLFIKMFLREMRVSSFPSNISHFSLPTQESQKKVTIQLINIGDSKLFQVNIFTEKDK